MSLRDQMLPAVTAFFDPAAHGVEVLYNYQRINVLVSGVDGKEVFAGNYDAKGKSRVLFLRVLKGSVPDPKNGDLVIIEKVQWKMKQIISSARFSWRLRFERDRRPVL